MTKQLLKDAAKSSGISIEQAEAFVLALSNPTAGMCEEGVSGFHSTGPFSDPADFAKGLTGGEFDFTKAAQTWRYMVASLLLDEESAEWTHEAWNFGPPKAPRLR